ncbi:MAG: type I-U CRISPR-associated protein Csx17 [Mobilicoccus sp.]|nr:type I-U CRISPR-associated protein Csx17 [Mobilicoccus sp.]
MSAQFFPGLRADTLLTYLAALGLVRVISREDPEARAWWAGDYLRVDTTVTDVVDLLVERYEPSPVFSPWNGGSGFGEKDGNQRAVIETIVAAAHPRIGAFAAGYAAVERVLERRRAATPAWSKERLVIELRNRVPVAALAWMDAAVVVGGDRLFFPSVYGTGGNDGRLEFSANYHQRLVDVIPELGAKLKVTRSWASDALTGVSTVPLKSAPAGQFEPVGAGSPNTFSVGAGQALVNPWLYVLMIEASGYLAASLTRAGQGQPRASVPFTGASSSAGGTGGSDAEESRGEFWAPLWGMPLQDRELRQLFSQARASWGGSIPTTAAAMYGAVRSHGVDNRIAAFQRYGLAQRNGLAFVAARRDRISVGRREGVDVALTVQARAARFSHGGSGRVVDEASRLDRAQIAFLATEDRRFATARLVDWLAALTARERSAVLSEKERDGITGAPRLLGAHEIGANLDDWLAARAEHRLAASLASALFTAAPGERRLTLRDLLMGRPPEKGRPRWLLPVVNGYGTRPLDSVLADLAVWRDTHALGEARDAGQGIRFVHRHRYRCRWPDVTRWVKGELDERMLDHALAACLSLEWGQYRAPRIAVTRAIPDPAYAVLSAVASGDMIRASFAPPRATNTESAPQGADAGARLAPDDSWRAAFPTGWVHRLRAGRLREVVHDAAPLLSRHELYNGRAVIGPIKVIAPLVPVLDGRRGTRLAASLLAPSSHDAVEAITGRHTPADAEPDADRHSEGAPS